MPDVIALREQLYAKRAGYHMIGSPVAHLARLDAIPSNKPVFVAEGLVMYLHEKDGIALFQRISEQFPRPTCIRET